MRTLLPIALAVLTLQFANPAQAADFSGDWIGRGYWLNGSADDAAKVTDTLQIIHTDNTWSFKECWFFNDAGGANREECINNVFVVDGNALTLNGKKVGDIYPDRILIYQGNRQVGEQIYVEAAPDGGVRYRYTYVNMDGASERREALLKAAPHIAD